ncbi:uncharacterized protein LOC130815191 [Amaranthus tricolor]|uniref:uncharacterized protein LOC130815191 n=1 Tax=Amaranthus tricolor TaxID=29722 RepID=UPI00258865B6|nr:uncharacterized protein LOC130815191 [Amaranthus tricolor]
MAEDPKKRLQHSHHQITPSKKPKLLHNDDDEDFGFTIDATEDDFSAQELISDLLSSAPKTTPFHNKIRFVSYPYSAPSPFESCTSYITINGNEDTCGSSFSDSDSSVMASVDTSGVHVSAVDQSSEFLRVGNDAVFGFDGDEVKLREGDDDVWDWSDFLGEEKENAEIIKRVFGC